MSPAVIEEKIEKFRSMVGSSERVGVSEFARSKSWRDRLPEAGCFEVVDRSGNVVGYVLAPDYAVALNERMADLEEQAERVQIAAMFKAREDYTNIKTGVELKAGALDYFDKNIDALMEIIDGD